jgi:tetratricopeptide (TPR) repeat protein
MLRDRGIIAGAAVPETIDVPMPASVQQLIGARIDTLPPTEKDVLQDAAVVGKVFWSGAVEAVSGLPEHVVIRSLHESVKREFVRPVRGSSFEGQEEYAFNHLLVQQVAYGQIPRAARANRHVAVARWIRAVAADRVVDVAELLAHHYGEALATTKAIDPGRDLAGLEAATASALMMAGDRAKRLDASRAVELYRRARSILPPGDPERRRALLESAEAAEEAGRLAEAEADFEAAVAEYRGCDDRLGLGEALARRARSIQRYGDAARSLLEEAVGILETLPSGPELARAYTRMAGHLYVSGDNAGAIPWAEQAIGLADDLGVDEEAVLALQYRGAARGQAGDPGGLEDLREALRRGLELGLGNEVATTYNNLAYELWFWKGPADALPVWEEMSAFCRVRGFATMAMWAEAGRLEALFDVGRWDEVVALAEDLREWGRGRGPTRLGVTALTYLAWVELRRGDHAAASRTLEALLPRARDIGYADFLAPALLIGAECALLSGDRERARSFASEFEDATRDRPEYRRLYLPVAVRIVLDLGELDEATRLVEPEGDPRSRRLRLSLLAARADVAEARGEHERAAALFGEAAREWGEYGFGLEEARSRLGLGRCLLALGRESRPELDRARELLESMGARPMIDEVDALLAAAGAPAG